MVSRTRTRFGGVPVFAKRHVVHLQNPKCRECTIAGHTLCTKLKAWTRGNEVHGMKNSDCWRVRVSTPAALVAVRNYSAGSARQTGHWWFGWVDHSTLQCRERTRHVDTCVSIQPKLYTVIDSGDLDTSLLSRAAQHIDGVETANPVGSMRYRATYIDLEDRKC